MADRIVSASNSRLKLVRKLESRRQREKAGLFVCEGEDLVAAGLDAGLEPVEALIDADRPALADRLPDAAFVEPKLFEEVSALGHPPRVIAVFRREDLELLAPVRPPDVGLALWQVSDPGNVGTLIRTADALGPCFVALSKGCADPTSAKALRAAAGGIFRVPLGEFDAAPGRRIGLVSTGGRALPELDLSERICFVLGAEREGLPEKVANACDDLATIPLAEEADSLNVAVAGSIALYERLRRRVGG